MLPLPSLHHPQCLEKPDAARRVWHRRERSRLLGRRESVALAQPGLGTGVSRDLLLATVLVAFLERCRVAVFIVKLRRNGPGGRNMSAKRNMAGVRDTMHIQYLCYSSREPSLFV